MFHFNYKILVSDVLVCLSMGGNIELIETISTDPKNNNLNITVGIRLDGKTIISHVDSVQPELRYGDNLQDALSSAWKGLVFNHLGSRILEIRDSILKDGK
jgi:hypothetical protein